MLATAFLTHFVFGNSDLLVFLKEAGEALIGCFILAKAAKRWPAVMSGGAMGALTSILVGVFLYTQLKDRADSKWAWVEGGSLVFAAYCLLGIAAFHFLRKGGWMIKRSGRFVSGATRVLERLHLTGRSDALLAFTLVFREGAEYTLIALGSKSDQATAAPIVGTITIVLLVVTGIGIRLLASRWKQAKTDQGNKPHPEKLMRREYTDLLNWSLVAFGLLPFYNAIKPAREKHWPAWLLPTFVAVYLALSLWVFLRTRRNTTSGSRPLTVPSSES